MKKYNSITVQFSNHGYYSVYSQKDEIEIARIPASHSEVGDVQFLKTGHSVAPQELEDILRARRQIVDSVERNGQQKWESRTKSIRVGSVYDTHVSAGYCNDQPSSISFSQHKEDEEGEETVERVTLWKEDWEQIVPFLKEHEII